MSKVRQDKHKDLVSYQIFEKGIDRYATSWNNNAPRWRQSAKLSFEYFIRESKK